MTTNSLTANYFLLRIGPKNLLPRLNKGKTDQSPDVVVWEIHRLCSFFRLRMRICKEGYIVLKPLIVSEGTCYGRI